MLPRNRIPCRRPQLGPVFWRLVVDTPVDASMSSRHAQSVEHRGVEHPGQVALAWAGILLAGLWLNSTARSVCADDPGQERVSPSSLEDASAAPRATFESLTLRGRVVWLAEAMARRHGVKTVPEAANWVLALETADGELYALAEDIRGRGFRRDPRLRKMNLELLVRRYHGAPVVQVIRAFELTKEAKLELDYWCDICAIAMFELKPCDCCQGDIELRKRVVDKSGRAVP